MSPTQTESNVYRLFGKGECPDGYCLPDFIMPDITVEGDKAHGQWYFLGADTFERQ